MSNYIKPKDAGKWILWGVGTEKQMISQKGYKEIYHGINGMYKFKVEEIKEGKEKGNYGLFAFRKEGYKNNLKED